MSGVGLFTLGCRAACVIRGRWVCPVLLLYVFKEACSSPALGSHAIRAALEVEPVSPCGINPTVLCSSLCRVSGAGSLVLFY